MASNARCARCRGWLRLVAGLALLAWAGPARAALTPGTHAFGFMFDSQFRDYDLHVPPGYDESVPVPLVIDFHGFGSNKTQQRLVSGFQAQSDAHGFLVAYPSGLFNSWNAGVCCGDAVTNNIDDVGFAKALIDQVAQQARVDRRRVYVTGISNGGFMSHRLACEAADTFAAYAPMAAFIGVSPCTPSRPVPVHMFMGLTDALVPYATAAPSFAFWRNNAQCVGATPDQTVTGSAGFCETYNQCTDGLEVAMCSVTGDPLFSGHVIYANPDFDLAQLAWAFMSRYSLPPPTLDNFKCYKARDLKQPKFASTTVQLADQFGLNDGAFTVGKPAMFCTPTSLAGGPINDAIDHLTCYKVKGPTLAKEDRPHVDVQNELGALRLEVQKATMLCVPSSKTILP